MLFHESKEFEDLIGLTSKWRKIPSTAIRKDYFITEILSNIATCEYRDSLVFKGGTSLSKCYPGSIERFSEDIDLTYIPSGEININAIEKNLKKIEQCLIGSAFSEKNFTERNKRNKSCYIWFTPEHKAIERVKLEIGSETKPHPFQKKIFNSYIQDYLESNNHSNDVMEFGLKSVTINVLNIERTFLDKVMAVKRHAYSDSLSLKARHLYDVVRLYSMKEIQTFLNDPVSLKEIVMITKENDSFYLLKRTCPDGYDPCGSYDFESWKHKLDRDVRLNYESLHKNLLYSDEPQDWSKVEAVFHQISGIFQRIGE